MAEENGNESTGKATRYRVLKKHGEGSVEVGDGTQGVELYALLPGEFDGNVVRKAAADFGGGEYVAVPVISFRPRTVEIDTTPRIRVS